MNLLPSNLALQRTRPAMAQHATFRLTKRTFSETVPRSGKPAPDPPATARTPEDVTRLSPRGG